VLRPVRPKSQTQRRATANPSADGSAASHRQLAAVSTRKPGHWGGSQNHKPKNAAPTVSEAVVVGHPCQRATAGTFPAVSVRSRCPFRVYRRWCAASGTVDSVIIDLIEIDFGGRGVPVTPIDVVSLNQGVNTIVTMFDFEISANRCAASTSTSATATNLASGTSDRKSPARRLPIRPTPSTPAPHLTMLWLLDPGATNPFLAGQPSFANRS
jgi:hypothetical protein